LSEPRSESGPPRTGSAGATPDERARLALITGASFEEKLQVVAEGDPLGLIGLADERVRARWLFLDPGRVFEESVFQVVAVSALLTREDDLRCWLVARVDEAIEHLLRRDGELLLEDQLPEAPVRANEAYLSGCFALPPALAFRAAARFNWLPERSRRCYFAVVVEGRSLSQCLESGLGPREELRDHVTLAIETVLSEVPASSRKYATEDGTGEGA